MIGCASGYHQIIPLMCAGRSSEVLLGAGRGSCSWKVQLRISGAATVTIGSVVPGCCVILWVRSLVLCQDLAGSWYARHEHGCHGSYRDACPQGRPGVARPSDTSTKNIGREECRESRRKHVDRSDGSSREYWRIGRTHQITCRLRDKRADSGIGHDWLISATGLVFHIGLTLCRLRYGWRL